MRSVCAKVSAVMEAVPAARCRPVRRLWQDALVDRAPDRVAGFRATQGEGGVGLAGLSEGVFARGGAVARAVDERQVLLGRGHVLRRCETALQRRVQLLLRLG